MNINQFISPLLCAALFLMGATAIASDFQSPRAAALGGSGHAGPMLNDALYLNPSFVSFLPAYSIAGNYLFYRGPENAEGGSGDPHGHNLNVSLQDGRSELFQAGVGLTLFENRKIINVGASKLILQKLGVGLGGKFVIPNTSSPSPILDSTLSVTGVPFEWLQLAGIIDNIYESELGRSYGLYREYILGTKFNLKGIFLAYFDPHWAPHAPDGGYGHELGIEVPIMQDLFIRVGNFQNAHLAFLGQRGRGYSAGLGWIAPKISFDYALQRALEPTLATAHSLGFTIYF